VRISGLPLSLEPGSLRARVVNGPPGLAVIGVRPTFDVELAEAIDVPLEARQLEDARDAAAALQVAHARVESEIKEMEALRPRFRDPKPGEPPRAAAVSSMVALADFAATRLSERYARRRELRRQLDDAEEQVRLRERRMAEAGTARRSERARTSRAAVVTLSAPASAPAELAIETWSRSGSAHRSRPHRRSSPQRNCPRPRSAARSSRRGPAKGEPCGRRRLPSD
jgi:hypothetical protein